MRKVIKEYNVYKFNELDKDVQEKVLERYTESEHEFYIDNELYDDMVEQLHNFGIENEKIFLNILPI